MKLLREHIKKEIKSLMEANYPAPPEIVNALKGSLKLRNIHTDDAPSEPHCGRIWKEVIKQLENTTGESKFSDT